VSTSPVFLLSFWLTTRRPQSTGGHLECAHLTNSRLRWPKVIEMAPQPETVAPTIDFTHTLGQTNNQMRRDHSNEENCLGWKYSFCGARLRRLFVGSLDLLAPKGPKLDHLLLLFRPVALNSTSLAPKFAR